MNQNHKTIRSSFLATLLMLMACLSPVMAAKTVAAAPQTAAAPSVPNFTLTDTHGKPCRLSQFQGHPTALFFFCGCPWCRQCAETWAKFQRGEVLPVDAPQTLVVFSGNAADADRFAAETGLDPAQTTLLPDPDLRVTTAFQADPCPRIFVLNRAGTLAYTNSHADDAPRRASALVIASRTLDALRGAAVQTPSPAPSPKPLSVLTTTGKPLNLALKPGWKVLYFWSSACPCVTACERSSFRPLAAKYQGQIAFYAVIAGRYDLSRPRSLLLRDIQARHLPYPVVLDPGGRLAASLGATVTPQTFLINPQGHIVFQGMPDNSRLYSGSSKQGVSHSYLAEAVSQALAGKSVTVPVVKDLGCLIGY